MRGRMAPDHWAAEVPHGADHSSPASFQLYFICRQRFARHPIIISWNRIQATAHCGGVEGEQRGVACSAKANRVLFNSSMPPSTHFITEIVGLHEPQSNLSD